MRLFARSVAGGPTAATQTDRLPRSGLLPLRFDRHELAGGVADIGIMIPLACGVAAAAHLRLVTVFVCVAAVYAVSALAFRIPVPVQPMKAMAASIIALGFLVGWGAFALLRRAPLHDMRLSWPALTAHLAPSPEPLDVNAS